MILDPSSGPWALLVALAATLLLRDLRSIKNLEGFFNAAEKLVERGEAAPLADDLSEMGRSVMSARLARQMARLAFTGRLTKELRAPGQRSRAFVQRWSGQSKEPAAERVAVLRTFVWELTRSSLVFGSAFGAWLLWRTVRHGDHAADWAVLAAQGIGVRAADRR